MKINWIDCEVNPEYNSSAYEEGGNKRIASISPSFLIGDFDFYLRDIEDGERKGFETMESAKEYFNRKYENVHRFLYITDNNNNTPEGQNIMDYIKSLERRIDELGMNIKEA